MVSGVTYPAASVAAPRIHAHFSRELAEARGRAPQTLAALPDVGVIEAMIGAAFWASLRREEGYVPKISLAFLPPSSAAHPLTFERPLDLDSTALTRVAPAVERAGIHLGVWDAGEGLAVWGTTREVPAFGFVLEVAAPGLLVVKHQRGERGKFVNVAVLEGDVVKIVDERASKAPDVPALVGSLLGGEAAAVSADSPNIFVQLAVSMRAHGRGGLMLVVPSGDDAWMESIVRPIPYAISPAFSELALLANNTPPDKRERLWRDALARSVDAVAGLTAVDGAAVMTTGYELLAFGAKIARRKGWPQIEQVVATEPIEHGAATLLDPAQLGGTRHLSAAQFVHDQRDAVALVASQDGRFTIFAWSRSEDLVHAHRVEILLL